MRGNVSYLDPVLHVSVINDLQDLLLLDGEFIWLRRLQTTRLLCLFACLFEAQMQIKVQKKTIQMKFTFSSVPPVTL